MGYSQQMVATLLGHKTASHISAYERGKRLPSLENAFKLAIILSTSVDFLYYDFYKELKQEIQHARRELYGRKK